jgi:hypothetical protein
VEQILAILPELDHPQVEISLLRSCVGFPKINFSLRTCNPEKIRAQIRRFDSLVQKCLLSIVGAPMTADQIVQCGLPFSFGGLGIQSAVDLADAAFVASVIQTRGVQTSILGRTPEVPGFTEALHRLNAKLSDESQIDPAALAGAKNVQKVICGRLNTVIFDSLLAGSIRRDRARLRACRMPYAAAWLSVPPIRALGLCFHPREYRTCLRLWLGAKQFNHSAKLKVCPACNKSILDDWGIHAVMCAKYGDRISKHDHVRDIFLHYLRMGALSSRKVIREAKGLITNKKDKPADIFVTNWSGGRKMALDVTIVNPQRNDLVDASAAEAGVGAAEGERVKMTKCAEKCKKHGFEFIPLAFETFGGYGKMAIPVVKTIISQAADRTGMTRSAVAIQMRQRISLAIMRANANMILTRI